MPEIREVFEMVTKQTEPDLDAWHDQERRQRRAHRNRRLAAAAVAAAFMLVVAVALFRPWGNGAEQRPAGEPTVAPDPPAAVQEHAYVDLRTGEVTPLPNSIAGGYWYSVSPDGTSFAFHPCCDPPVAVSVADLGGTLVRRTTPEGVDAYGARWSPDGSTLVYQGRDGRTLEVGNLFTVDVATGEVRRITDLEPRYNGWWFLSPTFTPDGGTVLFHMPRRDSVAGEGPWDLWSVPVEGGEPTLVRRDAGFAETSPDGRTIAYLSPIRSDFTGGGLWLVDTDGGGPRALVREERLAWPRWSPGGTRIAYAAGPEHGQEIFVVEVATGETTRVASGGVAEWFDNHTLVVGPG